MRVPSFVLLVLHLLVQRFRDRRLTKCLRIDLDQEEVELFRVDMKAVAETVVIAGWETSRTQDTRKARWFRMRFDRQSAPWMFRRGEPFRLSQSLELLAALVALMIFVPREGPRRHGRARMRGTTDNKANRYVAKKLLTTKWPGLGVLCELTEQLERRNMVLQLDHVPRLQNEEADALTNDVVAAFTPGLELKVVPEDLEFAVLHDLLETGEQYYAEEYEAIKRQASEGCEAEKAPKKRPLRQRDPW